MPNTLLVEVMRTEPASSEYDSALLPRVADEGAVEPLEAVDEDEEVLLEPTADTDAFVSDDVEASPGVDEAVDAPSPLTD